MSFKPEPEAIDLLLDALTQEGRPQLVFPGEPVGSVPAMPQMWIDMLVSEVDPATFIERWWMPMRDRLPSTLSLLKRKTSCLGVLSTEKRPLSLLYCFGTEKSLFANRGFLPLQDYDAAIRGYRLATDLSPFYRVHDGWVDVFSGDGGPLPVAEWHLLGGDTGDSSRFLEIYLNGGMSMGFDLSVQPAVAYALWPDEAKVEPVANVWAWLDRALADGLEDLGDAVRIDE